ncbi:energy-coupling factor transporter ATPase [Sporolactobacillus sp. THM7-7]|nr:energy-coupling factor transporter ATPase [Sporolactobacillus sp. THM7-7]
MERQPLIRAEDVSFQYKGDLGEKVIPALNQIRLDIYPGEYVAIIGRNGSGKSTLSKHFNGILQPSRGDVWVDGWNTKEKSRLQEIRKKVGMVFQNPDNQIIATTVEDDVAFGLENIQVPPEEMDERIDAALRLAGLSSMRRRAPYHLSEGQKQRLAIAGVIAMRPACLVLDEATSRLDTYGRRELLRVIRRLNEGGMAIVTVTHHMSEAAEADRVIVLDEGSIVLQGPPREVFQKQAFLQERQLDVPAASRIAGMVHERCPSFRPDLIDSDEVAGEVRRLIGEGEK